MSTNWRIDYTPSGGSLVSNDAKTWGVGKMQRVLTSQAADLLNFTHGGQNLTASPSFAYDGLIRLYKVVTVSGVDTATKWFEGRVRLIPESETGRECEHGYTAKGPWVHMDELIYRTTWKQPGPKVGGVQTYTDFFNSHVFLGQNIVPHPTVPGAYAAVRIGIQGQMKAALDYLLARAAANTPAFVPFSYDVSGIDDFVIPLDEQRDITVAEVIKKMMRWVPDAVAWFDYSLTPPKLWIQRRASLSAVDLTLTV